MNQFLWRVNLGQRIKGKKSFEHSGRYISLIKYDYLAFISRYIIDQTHTCSGTTGTQVGVSVGRPVCRDFSATGNLLWAFTCKLQTHPGPFVSLWKPHKSTALKKERVPGHTPSGQHTEAQPEPLGRPASISDLPHLAFSIQGGSRSEENSEQMEGRNWFWGNGGNHQQ